MSAPLVFSLDESARCHRQERGKTKHEFVLVANVPEFPPTCVVCLMRTIDEPMEWRLSNTAIQTLAHRAHAQEIHKEEDRLISMLPPELRSKRPKG